MDDEFDKWNTYKKKLAKRNLNNFFYYERELWWCVLGHNLGVEINGKNELFERPVLIIKIFNKLSCWVLPLTSQDVVDLHHYHFIDRGKETSVILSQLRHVSTARLLRKIGTMRQQEFAQIKALIKNYLL
jgi:mRNA interferase MazF